MAIRHALRADGWARAAWRQHRLALGLALAAAALAAGVYVQGAPAVSYNYCSGSLAGGDHCDGSAVALVRNIAFDDFGSDRVCAGAVQGGTFYGTYACGAGSATKCYSGTLSLQPRLHNGESFTQSEHGQAAYGQSC